MAGSAQNPIFVGMAFIALGTVMLVMVPIIARRIRENPLGCLRDPWTFLGPRFGRFVGIAVVAMAGGFGLQCAYDALMWIHRLKVCASRNAMG